MAQIFNAAVMTNAGANLLTKAAAGKAKIEFVKIAVGNGNYSEAEKAVSSLQARTSLKSQKNTYNFSEISVYGQTSVKLKAIITNYDSVTQEVLVTAGYYINEMGLYAKEQGAADSTAILYSIAVVSGDTGDHMPPYNGYNPAQITQEYYATVNNSGTVTVNTAGAAALAEDFETVRKAFEALGLSVVDGAVCQTYEE